MSGVERVEMATICIIFGILAILGVGLTQGRTVRLVHSSVNSFSRKIASQIKRVNATRRAWYAVVASRRFVKEVCYAVFSYRKRNNRSEAWLVRVVRREKKCEGRSASDEEASESESGSTNEKRTARRSPEMRLEEIFPT
ncbi:Fibroblast growth factor receptor [Temnothorax longispinosus]|uniref:Fibroblast growth factor receptor n=1 Tax=Temnothorax longispinosus TaxID=300112 RepID=A0A4S2KIN2_9HYME|nr:Fibroblast growth factor receptor [Temnothorax longispinosus]